MIALALWGPLAAFGSSCTWAFASARYAQASRDVGSARVNLARAIVVVPIYLTFTAFRLGAHFTDGVTVRGSGWLLGSVLCSYAIADNLFFTAARRIGISTALSIASTYPLWAALVGAFYGERFGPLRAAATLLCVFGVVALVRLAPDRKIDAAGTGHKDTWGIVLAFITSILWAGNSVSIKHGAVGLDVFQANAIRYLMALVLLGAQVLLSRTPPPQPRPVRGWASLLPAIIADAFFGSVFYVYGLSHTDLSVGAPLSSQAPLLSVPIAILMGEERWSPARFLAVTVTVTGVVVLIVGG